MPSVSKSSLCLTAMIMAGSTSQGQMPAAPNRNRSKQEFGRTHQQEGQQQQRRKMNLRRLEASLSMPLEESEFDMSMPSASRIGVMMMSIPLQEPDFDVSTTLHEALDEELTKTNESELHCSNDETCDEGTHCDCWLSCTFCLPLFGPCGTCEIDQEIGKEETEEGLIRGIFGGLIGGGK